MAANCDVCAKGPSFGHSISHSHVRTKRRWNPNIQRVRAIVNGAPKRLNVCTSCLKAGKVLSAKNLESLIAARDSLTVVIKAAGQEPDSDDEASSAAASEDEAQAGKSSLDARTKSALAMASFTASL